MKHPNWPVYELVTVPAAPGVSLAVSSLCVPRSLLGARYQADDQLTPFATSARPDLIQFGRSLQYLIMCLDVRSGEVVSALLDRNGRALEHARPGVEFVNSSLDQFNRSVEVVTALFPYDGNDPDYDDWQGAADKLETALKAVDDRAFLDGDDYWSTFYWDVTIGDFATEDILS